VHRNIPWLREIEPDPLVEIHPDTAKSLHIGDGEWVWVENWMGRCKLKAKVSPIVPRWMVMAAEGWWFPEKPAPEPHLFGVMESNINQLIPMGVTGKDGLGAPLKHLLCRVYKVGESEEAGNA
jgi:anaerobic selenocysteine-containing dehydrogenase